MSEIKCPHCNKLFSVDDAELAQFTAQIRNEEFEKELNVKLQSETSVIKEKYEIANKASVAEAVLKIKDDCQKEIASLKNNLQEEKDKVINLNSKIESFEAKKELAILQATTSVNAQMAEMKADYEAELARQKIELDYYKDLKAKMSTKMVGETLEQHCQIEFNKLRATAFRNAYFDKDNVVSKTGSKGDFIFRDYDENGIEILSIMFEMKNECDTTENKHKNEYFFKELDKDRREKNCEYAILVTMLEADNDLYNQGIVDVSYQYNKMYVVRPQFFIPIITILRNAALNSMSYKKELLLMKEQNMDITHFEENLINFKDAFSKNYMAASKKFADAISEIDKTIDHLQKVKDSLLSSDNQLRLANNKAEDLTIKKLTRNNPTMKEAFKKLKDE